MENIKYVQVKDPDSGALSESYLLEVEAQNVIFEDKENLVEKMAKKSDKAIYGDNEVNLGRIEDSEKGLNSITLGTENIASGDYSTATGYNTIAAGDHSHVEGRYNIEDTENRYAFIIGNGYLPEVTEEVPSPDPIRSNAFAVDWEGKVYAKTFINGDGAELYPSLKSIFVNDVEYSLNGGSLILQAGDNITLTPGVTEGTDNEDIVDGSLTVIISSTGGGSGSGGGDGEYLPLAGGKVYGPVIIERDTEKVSELEDENGNFQGALRIRNKNNPNNYLNISHGAITSTSNNKTLQLNKISNGYIELGNTITFSSTGTGGTHWNKNDDAPLQALQWGSALTQAKGYYSQAFGNGSKSYGASSFAQGAGALAYGENSHAGGYNSEAIGFASYAEGQYVIAKGDYSHAEGAYSYAYGIGSHAEGRNSQLLVIGDEVEDIKNYILENWNQNNIEATDDTDLYQKFGIAYGKGSHIQGRDCLALGDYSSANGVQTVADGEAATANGKGSTAYGRCTTVDGYNTIANGDGAYANGYQSSAKGQYTEAKGYRSNVRGDFSYVSGYNNFLQGNYSWLYGSENIIKGEHCLVFGDGHNANLMNNSLLFGTNINIKDEIKYSSSYNSVITQPQFAVVIGENISSIFDANSSGFNGHPNNSLIALGKNQKININYPNGLFTQLPSNTILIGENNIIDGGFDYKQNQEPHLLSYGFIADNVIIGKKNTITGARAFGHYIFGRNNNVTKEAKYGYTSSIFTDNYYHNPSISFVGDYNYSGEGGNYGGFIFGENNIVNCSTGTIVAGLFNTVKFCTAGDFIQGKRHNITMRAVYSSDYQYGANHIEGIGTRIYGLGFMGSHIEGGYHNFFDPSAEEQYSYYLQMYNYAHIEGYGHTIDPREYSNYSFGEEQNMHIEGTKNIIKGVLGNTCHIEGSENQVGNYYYYGITSGSHESHHIEGRGNQFYHTDWKTSVFSGTGGYGGTHIEGYQNLYVYHQQNWFKGVHIEGVSNQLVQQDSSGDYEGHEGIHIEGVSNIFCVQGAGTHIEGYSNQINEILMKGSHIGGYDNTIGTARKWENNFIDCSGYYCNFPLKNSSGNYLHIEGRNNSDDSSNYSYSGVTGHIEGDGNKLLGSKSGWAIHIEGYQNQACTSNHIEGYSNTALGTWTHVEGQSNTSTTTSQASHVEGQGCTVTGQASHAEGQSSYASGTGSHAEGNGAISYGQGSHAEGLGGTSGASLTDFSLNAWLPSRNFLIAYGAGSHAEGYLTYANGTYSHAEGITSCAKGIASHSEGNLTFANDSHSHAEGQNTIAYGVNSHAEGYGAVPYIGLTDYDISYDNWLNQKFLIAYGNYSHAEGSSTYAEGLFSHTEGFQTYAKEVGTHAEGSTTQALGQFAHAQNIQTIAEGAGSHAGGYLSKALGLYSFTHGDNVVATSKNQFVIGKYNIEDVDGEYAFILGNGGPQVDEETGETTDEIIYSNGVTIDWDGKVSATLFNGAINTHKIGNADFNGTQDITLEDMGVLSKEEIQNTINQSLENYSTKEETVTSLRINEETAELVYTNCTGIETALTLPIPPSLASDMPIGTIITNDNVKSSGFSGNWKCLGKNIVTLTSLDGTSTNEIVTYMWQRIAGEGEEPWDGTITIEEKINSVNINKKENNTIIKTVNVTSEVNCNSLNEGNNNISDILPSITIGTRTKSNIQVSNVTDEINSIIE